MDGGSFMLDFINSTASQVHVRTHFFCIFFKKTTDIPRVRNRSTLPLVCLFQRNRDIFFRVHQ